MPLTPNPFPLLSFSQASLQDYVDCRRRFQLRYLLRVAWPALETEPVQQYEHDMQQGERFHRMIQQHLSGVPVERLARMAQDPDLARWWQHYVQADLAGSQGWAEAYPEITLAAPFPDAGPSNQRLLAKYDLIACLPGGKIVIYDWKTSRRHPRRNWLAERLQTRLYPYLLTLAGQRVHQGRPVAPDQIEMIYWFAEFPEAPERFPYSADQRSQDERYLSGLVSEILHLGNEEFYLTEDEDRCRFCTYRSLCQRGIKAGEWGEDAPDAEAQAFTTELDFEQIAEIEF